MTYAKEHSELWDLQYNSDVIDFTVLSTVSHLKIPSTYLITYTLKSIVGTGGGWRTAVLRYPRVGNHPSYALPARTGSHLYAYRHLAPQHSK